MEKEKAAFPVHEYSREYGMSKRFYAACAAMQGLLAHHGGSLSSDGARLAFEYADELLKQE